MSIAHEFEHSPLDLFEVFLRMVSGSPLSWMSLPTYMCICMHVLMQAPALLGSAQPACQVNSL